MTNTVLYRSFFAIALILLPIGLLSAEAVPVKQRVHEAIAVLLHHREGSTVAAKKLLSIPIEKLDQSLKLEDGVAWEGIDGEAAGLFEILKLYPELANGVVGYWLSRSNPDQNDFGGFADSFVDLMVHGKGDANRLAEDVLGRGVIYWARMPDNALSDHSVAPAWRHFLTRLGRNGQPLRGWMAQRYLNSSDSEEKSLLVECLKLTDPGFVRALSRHLNVKHGEKFEDVMNPNSLVDIGEGYQHPGTNTARISLEANSAKTLKEFIRSEFARRFSMRDVEADRVKGMEERTSIYKIALPGAGPDFFATRFYGKCCGGGHMTGGFTMLCQEKNGTWKSLAKWDSPVSLAVWQQSPLQLVVKSWGWKPNWDPGTFEIDELSGTVDSLKSLVGVDPGECQHIYCTPRTTFFWEGGKWIVVVRNKIKPGDPERGSRPAGWQPLFEKSVATWDPNKGSFQCVSFTPMTEDERQILEQRPINNLLDAVLQDVLDEDYVDLGLGK